MLSLKDIWDAMKTARAKTKKKKSSAKLNPVSEEDRKLFKDVFYMVEATHHEQHTLWEEFHYRPKYPEAQVKSWEQVMSGHWLQIGTVDERPICVSIFYAILNGKRVMFYEGISQLVDHEMIEKWRDRYSGEAGHCNPANFHHCMQAIGVYDEARANKEKKNGTDAV